MVQLGSVAMLARGLVRRVDVCFDGLEVMSAERAQALMYAGFLSDVVNGAFDDSDPTIGEMLELVDEFCGLVESEILHH